MDLSRYTRQTVLPFMGEEGQAKLSRARVAILGCGALGTVAAEILARAGIGTLRLIDRDVVELSNLHRQFVYSEKDAHERNMKANVLTSYLQMVNHHVTYQPITTDFRWNNALSLLDEIDCVVDATDNYLARMTLNDACLSLGIPWVYGGALGTIGMTMNFGLKGGPCFRCLVSELPSNGIGDSCDTAGVLGSITALVASLQAAEVIKYLVAPQHLRRELLEIDILHNTFRSLELPIDTECLACQKGRRAFLSEPQYQDYSYVCGRNSISFFARHNEVIELATIATRLTTMGIPVTHNRFRLVATLNEKEVMLFPDGRVIINGTSDIQEARRISDLLFSR